MAQGKKKQKRYQRKTNAVSLTVYHPEGRPISDTVQRQLIEGAEAIVKEESLLLNIAKA